MFAHGEVCPEDGTRLMVLRPAVDPMLGRELDGAFDS
jgi:hypothetical protein